MAQTPCTKGSEKGRVQRPLSELVHALRGHIRLLSDYNIRARPSRVTDQAYLGEVAAKLRLLTSRRGRNKPLLLRLMEVFGVDTVELREHLDSPAYGASTSRGSVGRTNADVIEAWAAQHGAAHEDWDVSEEFSGMFAPTDPCDYPPLAILLHDTTFKVVAAAKLVFAAATPEAIAAAEERRPRNATP
jgi:hypothetical protein